MGIFGPVALVSLLHGTSKSGLTVANTTMVRRRVGLIEVSLVVGGRWYIDGVRHCQMIWYNDLKPSGFNGVAGTPGGH